MATLISSRILLMACLLGSAACSCAAAVPALHAATPTKPQGYLGIEFHDLTSDELSTLHGKVTQGACVAMVDHDGPAGKAGLRPHDVIVALNGQIVDGAYTLRRLIHDAGAGVSVALSVIRNGNPMTLTAKLASREDVERDAAQNLMNSPASEVIIHGFVESGPTVAEPAPPSHSQGFFNAMLHSSPFTGLALEAMQPQLAGFFGAPVGTGLLVNTVMPNSPAANAGLHAGDIILRADAQPMRTTSDWMKHLKASRGQTMNLVVLRDKSEQTLTLTPDLKHKSSVAMPALWPGALTLVA